MIFFLDYNVLFDRDFKKSIKKIEIFWLRGSRVPRMATPWGKKFFLDSW